MRIYFNRSSKCEDEEGAEGPIQDAQRVHTHLKDKGAPKAILRKSKAKISSARRAVKEATEATRALRDLAEVEESNPLRTKKAMLEQIGFNEGWAQMTPENKRIERSIQKNGYNKLKRARKARKGKK